MNQKQLAHSIWKEHLLKKKGQNICIVDATCGNGHDSLFLSSFENAELHCIDIQHSAIENTKEKLGIKKKNIHFHLTSHEDLSFINKPIDLITFNLGYLPGSNKEIITTPKSTMLSLHAAINKLSTTGMISIMIYTGHDGGLDEKKAILNFTKDLNSNYTISHHSNPLKPTCPELLIIN